MWAKLERLDGTSTASSLTFYYTEKGTLGDLEYEMNTGKTTPAWLGYSRRIQKVVFDKSFADARPTSCYKWFYDCYNIKTIESIENLNTSEVTDMSEMFNHCGSGAGVVVNLDVSHFDTSKVTDMSRMFFYCNTTSLDVSHFDTSKVTNMSEMFRCSNSITSLDLSNFDTSSVTDMSGMFSYSETLSYLNLSSFNTSHVQNMDCVFKNMPALKEVDITSFSTESVTSVREMFQTVNDPYFKGTSILEVIWASDKFNVTNLSSEKSENMFEGCTNLKEGEMPFDAKVVDNTFATTSGGYLAKHVRPWAKLEDGTFTFYYSYKGLRGDGEYAMNVGRNAPGWSDKKGDITKVVFDKSFADARPTTCHFWFYRCENLKTIEGIENLNTSKVTNMSRMFRDCYSLTSLDLSNFDTSNVTDMSEMFYACGASIDVSSFNTSKVVDMTSMFRKCGSATLDLSNFDTSNVTSMFCMFNWCDHIKELDLSSFNTSKVTKMSWMFENCSNLTAIYASDKFVIDKVETSSGNNEMFKGCSNLKGDISCDGVNNIGKTYAKVNGGYFTDAATAMTSWADIANGTLTFRYGARRRELEAGKEFKLNADNAAPDWLSSSEAPNITKVVFCKAFANARPTTCYSWFNGLKNLETIKGIENLKTSEVTNMNSMFSGCSSRTSLNCLFNTAKVTDMSSMFKGCSSLASLYISYFDTKAVKYMREMFIGCSSLKSLNLTSFNTQEQDSKNMNYMFKDCSQLKNIYVSGTFATNYTAVWDAFENCPAYLCCQPYQYATLRKNNSNEYSPFYKRIRAYVNINAQAPYGTLCVPFGSTLTEGSYTGFDKLYRVKGADLNEGTITLEESTTIEPGVAYVYRRNLPEDATASIITFTVDDTKESVTAPQNDGNLLKGTFLEIFAPIGSYLLQSDGNFHPVPFTATRMLRVPEYRAYLSLSSLASEGGEAGAKAYRMVFEAGETTGIGSINADQRPTPIYDLSGRRVNAPQKGGIYIVKGKKVMF